MKLLLLGALAFAVLVDQPKPNFSGTWILDSSTAAGSNAVPKVVVVLTQTDSALTLKNGDLTLVFPLDGSETTIKNPGSTGPRDMRVRARWEGGRLVVDQRTEATSINVTVSLSDDGNELTVETVAQTPQGEGREKQVFKKSP
jgi:signal transduction histidine kinase